MYTVVLLAIRSGFNDPDLFDCLLKPRYKCKAHFFSKFSTVLLLYSMLLIFAPLSYKKISSYFFKSSFNFYLVFFLFPLFFSLLSLWSHFFYLIFFGAFIYFSIVIFIFFFVHIKFIFICLLFVFFSLFPFYNCIII